MIEIAKPIFRHCRKSICKSTIRIFQGSRTGRSRKLFRNSEVSKEKWHFMMKKQNRSMTSHSKDFIFKSVLPKPGQSMPMLKLIYFKGCPNAKRLEYLLGKLGRKFKSVEQSDLPKSHPLRKYSSPTLLLNDQVVFGSPIEGDDGCSVVIPTLKELEERLRVKAPTQ